MTETTAAAPTTNLLASLGLENVSADPNAIPDNSYLCEVMKSEIVVAPKKDTIAHVITYKVAEGEHKGAQKQDWFELGNAPRKSDGQPATKADEVASYNPTMTDTQKTWYKKRLKDLGIPEAQVNTTPLDAIVGVRCVVNLKTEKGFQNIKWVNPAPGNSQPAQQTTMEDFATAAATPAATATATPVAADDPVGF